jgi:hypothetical protein
MLNEGHYNEEPGICRKPGDMRMQSCRSKDEGDGLFAAGWELDVVG